MERKNRSVQTNIIPFLKPPGLIWNTTKNLTLSYLLTSQNDMNSKSAPPKLKIHNIAINDHLNGFINFLAIPPVVIERIEPKHISQYLQWRKNNPPSTNIKVGLFTHIWNKAREWGYTSLPSPSQGVKKEDYILNKIYEFADQRMSDIIETTYLPGKRPIDICNIHRSHIFNRVLHITQQKNR